MPCCTVISSGVKLVTETYSEYYYECSVGCVGSRLSVHVGTVNLHNNVSVALEFSSVSLCKIRKNDT